MIDAVHAAVAAIHDSGAPLIDAIGLSLSCEFLAQAAVEMPESFRTLGFISPAGFENKAAAGFIRRSNLWVRAVLNGRPWSNALFRLMMRRSVIRRFVEKTWGSKKIDEGLLDYDCLIAYQSGAEHAPFSFIAGYMFTPHILDAYRALRRYGWCMACEVTL